MWTEWTVRPLFPTGRKPRISKAFSAKTGLLVARGQKKAMRAGIDDWKERARSYQPERV